MNPMKFLESGLVAVLNRLGGGWKSILGIAAMLACLILGEVGTISPESADKWFNWAAALTGVGIFHKAVKNGS